MRANLKMMTVLDKASLREIPEQEFQGAVESWAKDRDYLTYSIRRAAYQTRSGKWRGVADPGFPDIVFARRGDLFVAELKSETGTPSKLQRVWQAAFLAAGKDAYLWRPRDAAAIIARLERNGGRE
jgi:hypothetical protein